MPDNQQNNPGEPTPEDIMKLLSEMLFNGGEQPKGDNERPAGFQPNPEPKKEEPKAEPKREEPKPQSNPFEGFFGNQGGNDPISELLKRFGNPAPQPENRNDQTPTFESMFGDLFGGSPRDQDQQNPFLIFRMSGNGNPLEMFSQLFESEEMQEQLKHVARMFDLPEDELSNLFGEFKEKKQEEDNPLLNTNFDDLEQEFRDLVEEHKRKNGESKDEAETPQDEAPSRPETQPTNCWGDTTPTEDEKPTFFPSQNVAPPVKIEVKSERDDEKDETTQEDTPAERPTLDFPSMNVSGNPEDEVEVDPKDFNDSEDGMTEDERAIHDDEGMGERAEESAKEEETYPLPFSSNARDYNEFLSVSEFDDDWTSKRLVIEAREGANLDVRSGEPVHYDPRNKVLLVRVIVDEGEDKDSTPRIRVIEHEALSHPYVFPLNVTVVSSRELWVNLSTAPNVALDTNYLDR